MRKGAVSTLGLLTNIFGGFKAPVQGIPKPPPTYNKSPGKGALSAAKRLASKLKENRSIPSIVTESRQVRRSKLRRQVKKYRSDAKVAASRSGLAGGSASVT